MSQSLIDMIHQAGFTGSAAQTMYAIVMAESGGNANSLNNNPSTGDLSYGLAQINMIGSMGPERLKQYGLSSDDSLYDPLTNLKVAYALSNGGKDFTPWSTYKSGAYQQFMGQSTDALINTSTPQGGNGMTSSTPAPTQSDLNATLHSMGLDGVLTAVPELAGILKEAVAGGWTDTKFQQAVEASKWYKDNNQATRQLISLQYSDPAEYKTRVANAQSVVQNMANSLGVNMTAAAISKLTTAYLTSGWDTNTLQKNVGLYYGYMGGTAQGQAATVTEQLKQYYADYGIPMPTDNVLNSQVRNVLDMTTTADTYKQQAIVSAKSMYPSLSSQLDSGLTVKDIASPYMQQMSNLLEIDPNNIGIQDPLIKKALQGTVTTSGTTSTATTTPLWQFENTLRADPRWGQTQNARDTVSTGLVKIGQDFGFAV